MPLPHCGPPITSNSEPARISKTIGLVVLGWERTLFGTLLFACTRARAPTKRRGARKPLKSAGQLATSETAVPVTGRALQPEPEVVEATSAIQPETNAPVPVVN